MPTESQFPSPMDTFVVPTPPVRFVLDGSVTLAWLFHDERNEYADAIVARFPAVKMFVPRLWHLEIANVLAVSERRGRCTPDDTIHWLGFLTNLPILVDTETERHAWSESLNLARQHRLSVYDAAYLELAIRENIPIATLDRLLMQAAKTVGVALFHPE